MNDSGVTRDLLNVMVHCGVANAADVAKMEKSEQSHLRHEQVYTGMDERVVVLVDVLWCMLVVAVGLRSCVSC